MLASVLYSCGTQDNNSGETVNLAVLPDTVEKVQTSLFWKKTGFTHPESIIFGHDSSYLFVSNIGNNESDENPDGYIAKVMLDSSRKVEIFAQNIQSPKGLCIVDGKLYVSAVKNLLEFDLDSGAFIKAYSSPEVKYLNDVTKDSEGNIYVSGMHESAIYKLDKNGHFSTWYQNDSLDHPNGLLVFQDNMYVGSWGRLNNLEKTDSVGYFFKIDLKTKELRPMCNKKIGKIDGIQIFKDGKFFVSSWEAGEVLIVKPDGTYHTVLDTEISIGDILYSDDLKTLYTPMNFQNEICAFHID